jgi:hypothetical protein
MMRGARYHEAGHAVAAYPTGLNTVLCRDFPKNIRRYVNLAPFPKGLVVRTTIKKGEPLSLSINSREPEVSADFDHLLADVPTKEV